MIDFRNFVHDNLIIILLFLALVVGLFLFSLNLARFTTVTDYQVLYNVSTVINSDLPIQDIYNSRYVAQVPTPESAFTGKFIYSTFAAFLLAPLSWFPYYISKGLFIFVNIACYLSSIILLLRSNKAHGRIFVYTLCLSFLWAPFVQDMRIANLNGVMLFLLTMAIYSAEKGKPYQSGILLALAALFKLYPLFFAVMFGLKNWRVLAACLLGFGIALLLPDAQSWLHAIGEVNRSGTSLLLVNGWQTLFIISAMVVTGITGYIVVKNNDLDYFTLSSLCIPALFLIMPVVEYNHMVILIFPVIHVLTSNYNKTLKYIIVAASLLVCSTFFIICHNMHLSTNNYDASLIIQVSILLMWVCISAKQIGLNLFCNFKPLAHHN